LYFCEIRQKYKYSVCSVITGRKVPENIKVKKEYWRRERVVKNLGESGKTPG
jgi:hypothetical protein